MSSGRSMYEYMGNKRWLATARQEENGQTLLPGIEPVQPLDLDSRYTLRETLEWCKRKAGVDAYDLDAAACAEAHVADRYFTIADDGLKQPWSGHVWVNPPYSDIGPWVEKAWAEIDRCLSISMLLPATRTEQPWWQDFVERFRDGRESKGKLWLSVYFVPGRQTFGIPGNPLGIGIGSPPFGCVLLVWRPA